MFRPYFDIDLENAHISEFQASARCRSSVNLFAKRVNGRKLFSAWSLYLAFDTDRRDPTRRGKILNPHWIEKNIIRDWKRDCDGRNNKGCQICPAARRLTSVSPSWLLDTWRLCLTPGVANAPYVALSYVWGKEPFFKTTRQNLPRLELDQAFFESRKRLGIPKIKNMASIFTNATVTIIAMQGADANYGLRGLRDISEPRNLVQEVFTLEKGSSVISTQQQNEGRNPWSQRGWTFQEQIFARRQLVFSADRVQWNCAYMTPPPAPELILQRTQTQYKDRVFSTSLPDFSGYAELVSQYNDRQFTFPEDALDALFGITSVLSHKFYGGFICGLPALFFDMALIWQPEDTCERRIPSKPLSSTEMGLPSRSWVGWKGKLDTWGHETISKPRTIPLVQWYSRSWNKMNLAAIKEPLKFQVLKKRGLEGVGNLPPGWTRIDYHGVAYEPELQTRYIYKHDCDPTTEFWYPIPLCETQHSLPRPRGTDKLLCCRTQRTWAFLGQGLYSLASHHPSISIRNTRGTWIGELRWHDNKRSTQNPSQRPPSSEMGELCELVAISRGYFYEEWEFSLFEIGEWNHKERPRESEKYEYYNVLWVEWRDGIAYRKSCGRAMKSAWGCQELEWVDLVLG
ncbi:hypothetical protein NA56DRAFT_570240 [Hyaloscypha hepaticicola]|uniref:Heterokaryon incompatibility domain-containing protein n=1 Tax=Hyaloscypha hepaticicola TaxID=2082293 RepID=A0A2J6Q8H5_9HELO|nr:hypothetical protein NA56DRAFT_570240 [Hyaloscypha hepaticicola]